MLKVLMLADTCAHVRVYDSLQTFAISCPLCPRGSARALGLVTADWGCPIDKVAAFDKPASWAAAPWDAKLPRRRFWVVRSGIMSALVAARTGRKGLATLAKALVSGGRAAAPAAADPSRPV